MIQIRVRYRQDEDSWVATSPDLEEHWIAVGSSLDEVRVLAEDGVRFALERDDVVIEHRVPTSA